MKQTGPMARAKRLLLAMVVIYVSLLGALVFFETTLLFPAPSPTAGEWNAAKFKAKEEWVESQDGTKVHVWCMQHDSPKATIIFSHGNGESLGFLGWELAELRDQWSVNVIAYDFRGYGKTGGAANQKNILEDAVAVGTWTSNQTAWNTVPIVPMGRSLGGAAALEMAIELKSPGLILDRTFSSIVDVAAWHYPMFPVRWLIRNRFLAIDRISKYSGKLLQLHGDADTIIPVQFGKKLFDACPSASKTFLQVPDLGHNEEWPEEFWEAVPPFLTQWKNGR